ncbi:MAG: cold shock domain-containing protein [Dehalococcoidia bacterium]|jgi:CspA family cold shock protein
MNCEVTKFSDIRGFGFIRPQIGDDIFVHYSDIRGTGFRTLRQGQSVEFTVLEGEKGLQAKDVQMLD